MSDGKCRLKKKHYIIIISVIAVMILIIVLPIVIICRDVKPTWNYTWEDNGDMEIMKERMTMELYDVNADPSAYIADINTDGSFASIDYDTEMKDTWHPAKHLDYILTMQAAAYTPNNTYYNNAELITLIGRAIRYWIDKDYHCEWNGWWNGLGTGPKIANILLFPNNGIIEIERDKLTEKLYHMTCFNATRKYNVKEREIDSTGGNLTDTVNHSLKYAVLVRDGSGIKWLRRLMENELRPFPSKQLFGHRWDVEGIKADMSFQQHYETLYMGGYGEVFADGMNRFIKYTSATQFALSESALNFYQDFLLDGMQFSMRGDYRDINASGRGIVRKGELVGIAKQVREGCRVLLTSGANLARRGELAALLENRTAENDIGAGGHKYFWNSDYQVYNGTGYMATVRAASKRTKNNEALNGENVWGHYLGAGATMYYVNGDEYFDILPLWDWNKIPGTTTVQGYLPYSEEGRSYSRMGKTSFVGGVSNGKVGMSVMDYKDNSVRAKKAWFMFDEGVVCLGADISSSKKGDLYTTINQSLLRENVVYSVGNNTYSSSNMNYNGNVDWVYNNGIGYITSSPISINAGIKSGDWKNISERIESIVHSDTVLELGISHGNKPKNAGYDYTVLMNTSAEQTRLYKQNATLVTLVNNSECQAVYNKKTGTAMAVFWKKGTLKLVDGTEIKVSSGCTLIYEKTATGYKLYVSDPKQNGGKLKVTVNKSEYNVRFTKGMYAGQTVKVI